MILIYYRERLSQHLGVWGYLVKTDDLVVGARIFQSVSGLFLLSLVH